MSSDRPAEITSLLEKVEDAYCNTLGSGHDDGLSQEMAAEIILRAVLVQLLKFGLTSRSKLMQVERYLPRNLEYLEE